MFVTQNNDVCNGLIGFGDTPVKNAVLMTIAGMYIRTRRCMLMYKHTNKHLLAYDSCSISS